MSRFNYRVFLIPLIFALILLSVRYLFPLVFPFLLGLGLALLAEPMTALLCKKIPRGFSAAVSVTAAFCFFSFVLVLLGALLVRQLGLLSGILPDLEETAAAGMDTLSAWLQSLTRYAPGGVGSYLRGSIAEFFSGGSAMLDRISQSLLSLAGRVLSHVPDSAFGIGTALISGYMIAAKLPRLHSYVRQLRQKPFMDRLLSGLKGLRSTLGKWLVAQFKLSGLTMVILAGGFLLLRIPYAPLWAVLAGLVDAFPVLGSGTVLVPWSLVCLLQGETARGIGLLGIYAVAAVTRSIMEPKLVGKHLGIDPLMTLFAIYAGYKLWGLGGMLLAPMTAALAAQFLRRSEIS